MMMSVRNNSVRHSSFSPSHHQPVSPEFKSSEKRSSVRCQPSANSSYVEFLQDDKQVEMMKLLQEEIQNLKYENNGEHIIEIRQILPLKCNLLLILLQT
jgi:hypothetical protein